jgi:hypothetical protein
MRGNRADRERAGREFGAEHDNWQSLNPWVNTGRIQERWTTITVIGHAHKFDSGKYIHSQERETTEYRLIRAKTEREYKEKIKQHTSDLRSKVEAADGYYTWYWVAHQAGDSLSEEGMREQAVRAADQEMHHKQPIDRPYLKGSVVNADESEDGLNCGVRAFQKMYAGANRGQIKAYMDADNIYSDMGITKKKANAYGIKLEHFKKICALRKISFWAFDQFWQVIDKKVEVTRSYEPFMIYIDDFHCYPIVDPAVRKNLAHSWASKDVTTSQIIKKEIAKAQEEVTAKERLRFSTYPVKVDVYDIDELDKLKNCLVFYHAGNLKALLVSLLQKKKKEYIHSSPRDAVTRIQYDNDVWLYANPNYKSGTNWTATQKVCAALEVPFRMQSVTVATEEWCNLFFNPKGKQVKRQAIQPKMRAQIVKEQFNKCNQCKADLSKIQFEINHIQAVCNGGQNTRANLEALCKSCHDQISKQQAATRLVDMDGTCSYYNEESMKVFAASAPKTGILHNPLPKEEFLRDDGTLKKHLFLAGIDARKCRRNRVRYSNKYDWCVFSFLSSPEAFVPERHSSIPRGFYWIEKHGLKICPTRGNGWYSVPMVKYCLKKKLIELSDLKAVIIAPLGLKPDYFDKFIDHLISVFPNPEDEKLLKLCFNGWVGLKGSRKLRNNKMRVFNRKEAASEGAFKETQHGQHFMVTPKWFPVEKPVNNDDIMDENVPKRKMDRGEPDFYEARWSTEKFKMDSHMPIFMQILDLEAISLHEMEEKIIECGGKPCHYNTDCVMGIFTDREQVKKLKRIAETEYCDDDEQVLKYKMVDCNEEDKEFNFNKIDIPCKDTFSCPELKWITYPDFQSDRFDITAGILLKNLDGFLLTAPPGCGKTYLACEILKQLNAAEVCNLATGLTHQARKLLGDGAKTLHSALSCLKNGTGFYRFKHYKYILVDEVSMMPEALWLLLGRIKQMNPIVKIICIGDFKQLPPINCRMGDNYDYENSFGVNYICDGVKVELTKNRRIVDKNSQRLVDMYMNPDKVDRSIFPTKEVDRSICYTNRTRKLVNEFWMKKYAPEEKMRLGQAPKVKQSQDITVFVGLPLVAMKSRSKYELYNSDRFVVTDFNRKTVTIRHVDEKEVPYDDVIKIPVSEVTRILQPAYCITLHRCQGMSIDRPFTIYEWSKFDKNVKEGGFHTFKYVALSRARRLKYINIAKDRADENEGNDDEEEEDENADVDEDAEEEDVSENADIEIIMA